MPRISIGNGPSNGAEEREVASRAGTSFLISASRLDRSGSSSGTALPSPVSDVESPSSKDQLPKQASSSAPSTDGSGQETGSGQASLPDSSVESVPAMPAIAAPTTDTGSESMGLNAQDLIGMARKAYNSGNYATAETLLQKAAQKDATLLPEINGHLNAVRDAARAQALSQQTTSEEVPSQGGFLVP